VRSWSCEWATTLPVVACGPGHHDLGVDDPQAHLTEPARIRAIRKGADRRQYAGVRASDQQVRAGGVDLLDQGSCGEVAIREQVVVASPSPRRSTVRPSPRTSDVGAKFITPVDGVDGCELSAE
jgi:hypothetical protein